MTAYYTLCLTCGFALGFAYGRWLLRRSQQLSCEVRVARVRLRTRTNVGGQEEIGVRVEGEFPSAAAFPFWLSAEIVRARPDLEPVSAVLSRQIVRKLRVAPDEDGWAWVNLPGWRD